MTAPGPDQHATRHARSLHVVLAASAQAVARIVAVAGQLLLVPILIDGLGTARYGAWAALAAALGVLPGLDLGAGPALLAHVAQAGGRSDRAAQARAIQAALQILVRIALTLMAALAAGLLVIGGLGFTEVPAVALDERGSAGAWAASLALCGLPLTLAPRAQIALRQGHRAALYALVGSLLTLSFSVLAMHLGWGLTGLALALVGGTFAANLASSCQLFGRDHPELRPRRGRDVTPERRALSADMLSYSVLYASSWAAATGDPLLVEQALGDPAAATYAATQQWLFLPAQAVSLIVQPLSSAFAEAWGRGDRAWCRTTLRRVVPAAALGAAAVGALIGALSGRLLHAWSSGALTSDHGLVAGLVVSGSVGAAGAVCAAFLNATGVLRPQVWMAAGLLVSSLTLKWLGMRVLGLSAVGWAYALSYALCVGIPYARLIPRLLAVEEEASP